MYRALPRVDNETAESLRVRTGSKTNMGDIVVGVCKGLPHHERKADDAFFRQLEETSHSQAHGTLTTLMSARETRKQGTSKLGDF